MNETDYSKYTVLVVDDIPVNVLLVKGMLSKLKFNIISANSGQQALDLLNRTTPDIILMDIMMPGMNGFEATKAIRMNPATSDIPVIILSALNSDTDIKEGLEAGANEFITKPFIQERIVNCIINQINLSENKRKKQQENAGADMGCDAAMRLFASMICQNEKNAIHLADIALCLPLALLDETLYALPDYTEERLMEWAVQRMQKMEVRNNRISANTSLSQVIGLLQPIASVRQVTFQVNMTGELNISADATLLKTVFVNLLSCACRMCIGKININGSMDGGLANITIACMPGTIPGKDTDFRVALALEAASRMNGAVVCEHSDDGLCVFQVLLQA